VGRWLIYQPLAGFLLNIAAVHGTYGLPHSGLLANDLPEKQLNKHGYQQSKSVPGLWTNEWYPIASTLVVDDFGVKYMGEEHAYHHLKSVLEKNYKVGTDWSGARCIGISLDLDDAHGYPRQVMSQEL
jgi:hypothetical protein